MSIETDIDLSVSTIRNELAAIRQSGIDVDAIESELDSIDEECDTMDSLDYESAENDILYEMGLGDLVGNWDHIDVGTASELKDAVARILKDHGY